MTLRKFQIRRRTAGALILLAAFGVVCTTRYWTAQAAPAAVNASEVEFEKFVKPFFEQNCILCHSTDTATAGIRVDQLDASFEDRQIRPWEAIRQKVGDGTMPPEGLPQPTADERKQMVAWITQNIEGARVRVAPKNGLVRRLTVAQYRNTLQELLKLQDDLTNGVPPDAISRDGFVNNQETLNLSTQLLESYLEIADTALSRALTDPKTKPSIQDFRVDLGLSVNPEPFLGQLSLGADSGLLENKDVLVTQPALAKPFAFDRHMMQTKYRYIEGYQGNDTVRGWREFDSIYHAVFADMRGTKGYPKGEAFDVVREGLLLRPAIPSDEERGGGSTEGPQANFKISTRELPDDGRFRITVMAAKYNDGLLLSSGAQAQADGRTDAVTVSHPATPQTVTIAKSGVYQVDVYSPTAPAAPPAPDASRLTDGLSGAWALDGKGTSAGTLHGKAKYDDSQFGQVLSFDQQGDSLIIPRTDAMNVGSGDFTISLWVRPDVLRKGGIVALAPRTQEDPGTESTQYSPFTQGWYLDMDSRGNLRLQTAGADTRSNGAVVASGPGAFRAIYGEVQTNGISNFVAAGPGALRTNAWQQVAIVVKRGAVYGSQNTGTQSTGTQINATRIYVNGVLAGKGDIGPANLDNPKADLEFGRGSFSMQDGGHKQGNQFHGKLHDLRIYKRALNEAEVQALLQPGKQFMDEAAPPAAAPAAGAAPATPRRQQAGPVITLTLGDRQFTGVAQQAFLAVRLDAGPLKLNAQTNAMQEAERIVLTPLSDGDETARKFLAFEKRTPLMGVHLGFRRDCGSTFAPVGTPQTVTGSNLTRYVFEGTMRNFPNNEVEKDNVNYLAGVREIAIHSEYTDGRDMPRLLIRSVEFEGPYYESWPTPAYRNIFVESSHKNDPPAYAQDIVRSFATRAFRRPATNAEVDSLMAVYRRSAASGRVFQDSVKDALEVTLTSPQFLFLVENSQTPGPEPLDEYELASKLSYFLWNGPPDRTTLNLAARGLLHKQLDAEVTRMTEDAKFSRFVNEFTSQWLQLDKVTVLEPDRSLYPQLSRATRAQLRQEPIEFVEYLMRHNLPVRDLISSDFIVANETVAGYYGLGDKTESGFRFVPIVHGRPELGGVLTQAAIMAGLSDGRESNPVKRGAWVARKIIAEPPADPPPNVPALKADTAHTLRERIEQHRNQPGCRQCHVKIDPWGIALEEFDAGGRLKQNSVDARSTLPDKTEVSGANELKRYLAEDRIDQVAYSVLKHLATYGTGRTLTYNELDVMRQDEAKLKTDGYRMKDMVRFVVDSKMFLEK